jgi:parvulin-like peptidyl-prolyl isomerase
MINYPYNIKVLKQIIMKIKNFKAFIAANAKALIVVVCVCLAFIIAQTSQVSAISVKELLGLKKTTSETTENKEENSTQNSNPSNSTEWANSSIPNRQIDLDYVTLLINNIEQKEREKLLADKELFKQVIENEANNHSTTSAAIANNLVEDRDVEFMMRRGSENILREVYLKRLISSKLPKDFPSDEQVAEYFTSNKKQFLIPERVHVWQIFFKKTSSSDKQREALNKKIEGIISDIKKGEKDFSNVALAQSEHEQSKNLGGYMGLLKTNELIPEMKDPILKLKEGDISQVIETKEGMHILKRGKLLESEALELTQVDQQIRQLLVKQANMQLRDAVFNQARKEYPQPISDNKLEEWRLRLQTKKNK